VVIKQTKLGSITKQGGRLHGSHGRRSRKAEVELFQNQKGDSMLIVMMDGFEVPVKIFLVPSHDFGRSTSSCNSNEHLFDFEGVGEHCQIIVVQTCRLGDISQGPAHPFLQAAVVVVILDVNDGPSTHQIE
jgi:hypothetical protein